MSRRSPIPTAIAFRLTAALEAYQMHMDALRDPWKDRRLQEKLSAKFDEIRRLKGALPELSVAMVEVLMAHVELMRALWLAGASAGDEAAMRLPGLRQNHARSVQRMKDQCSRLFARSATS